MNVIIKEFHVELHPENSDDVSSLKKAYPNLWPFQFVCVTKATYASEIAAAEAPNGDQS